MFHFTCFLLLVSLPTIRSFTVQKQTFTENAGSYSSSFTAHSSKHYFVYRNRGSQLNFNCRGNMLMYEPSNDPPNSKDPSKKESSSVWSALASTERWITDTLSKSNRAAAPGQPAGSNPYARKEVSYVCETTEDAAMSVANIFRRVREARELGENHSRTEERTIMDRGPDYRPGTLRQTQVVVIPWCDDFSSFQVFDGVVHAINRARRGARDYVTDISLEKLNNQNVLESERDWIVSINTAPLHPNYGEKTAGQILAEMKKEDEDGEIDLNVKEYLERRDRARRSPYPTVVIEVRSTPPPDFGNNSPQAADVVSPGTEEMSSGEGVSKEAVQKLEALFGQSAAITPKRSDDAFYDAIGKAFGDKEISMTSPFQTAQNWVAANDPLFELETSTFTSSDSAHVDAAYEFTFNNIAMQMGNNDLVKSQTSKEQPNQKNEPRLGPRSYLVMQNFVSSSATSFEKFAVEVTNIISAIPGLKKLVSVSTLHPEHVLSERRSPSPILVLQWCKEFSS